MANSRSLLVYVLALLVCGGSHFWVDANTAPIVRNMAPESSQLQHQQVQPQHQRIPETSVKSPSSPVLGPSQAQQGIPQQSSTANKATPTVSIKNGWGLSAGNSRTGPYTSGYGYISGRNLNENSPYNSYMTDYDLTDQNSYETRNSGFTSSLSSLLGGLFQAPLDWKSAVAGGAITTFSTWMGFPEALWATVTGLFNTTTPTTIIRSKPVVPAPAPVLTPAQKKEDIIKTTMTKKETSIPVPVIVTDAAKSRRRRSVEIDTDLTELAALVLSAVQSGECMQRSICLLGSQIGATNKGRVAFTLVDKLIPESVQGNQYFVTLKKALRGGENFCDKFRCQLQGIR